MAIGQSEVHRDFTTAVDLWLPLFLRYRVMNGRKTVTMQCAKDKS